MDSDEIIGHINFVCGVSTAQNMANMEKIVQDNLDVGRSKERITVELERIAFELEIIIRIYDPYMSCATRFLKGRRIEGGSKKGKGGDLLLAGSFFLLEFSVAGRLCYFF
ncbi:MAG: hypothetical protein QXW70_02065 [Candidatus Anstonellales archaeon]